MGSLYLGEAGHRVREQGHWRQAGRQAGRGRAQRKRGFSKPLAKVPLRTSGRGWPSHQFSGISCLTADSVCGSRWVWVGAVRPRPAGLAAVTTAGVRGSGCRPGPSPSRGPLPNEEPSSRCRRQRGLLDLGVRPRPSCTPLVGTARPGHGAGGSWGAGCSLL